MSAFETRAELAAKIDWEGGLESFMEYCDGKIGDYVPEGDTELMNAAATLEILWDQYADQADIVMDLLPEPGDCE